MVRNAIELMQCIETSCVQHNLGPEGRVIVREGPFGAERVLEHVVVRIGIRGPELILQAAATPLDG